MAAVPVANPRSRKAELNLMTDANPSSMRPMDNESSERHLEEVSPGHFLMPE